MVSCHVVSFIVCVCVVHLQYIVLSIRLDLQVYVHTMCGVVVHARFHSHFAVFQLKCVLGPQEGASPSINNLVSVSRCVGKYIHTHS